MWWGGGEGGRERDDPPCASGRTYVSLATTNGDIGNEATFSGIFGPPVVAASNIYAIISVVGPDRGLTSPSFFSSSVVANQDTDDNGDGNGDDGNGNDSE